MIKEMLSEGSKFSSKRGALLVLLILLIFVVVVRQTCGEDYSIPDSWFNNLINLTGINLAAVLGDKGAAIVNAWKSKEPKQ